MKKLIVCLCAVLLAASMLCGALASTVVITGDANVRLSPSLNGYKLGTVVTGTTLYYRGVYSRDSRGVIWYGVTFNYQDAWVSSRYSYVLYDDDDDDDYDDDEAVVVVTGDSNIRDYPSLNGKVLTVAYSGYVLDFTGDIRTDSRGVDWYYVYCNGYWGWISSRYSYPAN